MTVRAMIRRMLNRHGYDIHTHGWKKERLAKTSNIKTIFDIGVGHGTPELYRAFPSAYFVLVEPNPAFELSIKRTLQRLRGEYIAVAAGSKPGTLPFNIFDDAPERSSMYHVSEPMETEVPARPIDVPVTTLDHLAVSRQLEPPYGIKIDTEGFELEVIRGASEVLKRSKFVIAETSVQQRFKDSYEFADMIMAMKENNFVLIDILYIGWRPDENRAVYLDAYFVPAAS